MKRILCPTDLSEPSGKALAYAASLARDTDAELPVVHVLPALTPPAPPLAPIPGSSSLPALIDPDRLQRIREALEDWVEPARARGRPRGRDRARRGPGRGRRRHFGIAAARRELHDAALERLARLLPADARGATVTLRVAFGKAHREILRAAEDERVDLVVLGIRGRGAAERLLFGSTTDRVVREAPCPVLTVVAGRVAAGALPAAAATAAATKTTRTTKTTTMRRPAQRGAAAPRRRPAPAGTGGRRRSRTTGSPAR